MAKGECTGRATPLHPLEGSEESLPYRYGGCNVALENTMASFPVVLGLRLRMRERPSRLREGTRRRRSTRDVASWLASLIERKVKCRSGDRVAPFRGRWLRRSPRDVDGASCPFPSLEKPLLDAQHGGLRRNNYGKPLLASVLLPGNHEPCR
jgi:hypothetical protein